MLNLLHKWKPLDELPPRSDVLQQNVPTSTWTTLPVLSKALKELTDSIQMQTWKIRCIYLIAYTILFGYNDSCSSYVQFESFLSIVLPFWIPLKLTSVLKVISNVETKNELTVGMNMI